MPKDEARKRIDEEIVCVDCLAHCLKAQCGCVEVTVEREHNDQPDFWITVDGDTFAAEVTSIVTDAGYWAKCKKLKDVVKRSMCQDRCNRGVYALLTIRQPGLPRENTQEWDALLGRALTFIRDTRDVASTKEYPLIKDRRGRLGIQKVGRDGVTVGLAGVAPVKREGAIRNQLADLMQNAIREKRRKLEKKGVPAQCSGVMLLFYDAYGYADIDDAQESLANTVGHEWFHSVFWAASFTHRLNELSPGEPGREGKFLFSREVKWLNSPTSASP